MATMKVAVTIDSDLLQQVDWLVAQKIFPNRSRAVQDALQELVRRQKRNRLARECAKLDPSVEQALAEEGMQEELALWPEY
jgi:metal-responsive CopG/Arc/MetJ family transcriptional regulator